MKNSFYISSNYPKHYYAGTQRVSSKIGTTENLGDYLQDWYTSGTGGPIDVIGSSFGVLENAEDGVIQVYEEFDIEPPTYESTPVFIPVQSFIHGGNELEQYYFHPDHLGSTSYITNLLGEVSQHMEYFAFGETFVEEHRSSNNSPYKFNGKELDEETGWYYYGARYYDPRISIWLSVDPLAEQTMTPYVYVNNNPVNLIDPTGMKSETWIVNRDSGEATYIDDGSEDIVIVQGNEYNTIIELGQDATGECTGDCNLDSWDMYQDYLKQGERHTSENFSTGNKKADNNIMSLDPRARTPMILSVIQARLEGIDVRGAYLGNHRTYAEQNELYKQGRTKPGGIVTNAVGGQSNHNFGMAMDVAIF